MAKPKFLQVEERVRARQNFNGREFRVETEEGVTKVEVWIGAGMSGSVGGLGAEEVAWLGAVLGEIIERAG